MEGHYVRVESVPRAGSRMGVGRAMGLVLGCLRDTLVRFLSVWSVPVPGGFQERPYLKTILVWKVSHLILSFVICAPPPPHIPNTRPYLPPFLPRSLLHSYTKPINWFCSHMYYVPLSWVLCSSLLFLTHTHTHVHTHTHTRFIHWLVIL